MVIGGKAAQWLLKRYRFTGHTGDFYAGKSKLETCLGPEIWQKLAGKRILDLGCGEGSEVLEIAQWGQAKSVVGVDISEASIGRARARASELGMASEGLFATRVPAEPVDVVISLDAFEHYSDPLAILRMIYGFLAPGGTVLASFGPPWLHPWGSHIVLFPWSHLVLTEAAIMTWRSQFKNDGAVHYGEVEGGLNQMTIRRFLSLAREAGFAVRDVQLTPIRGTNRFFNRLTQEFLTSVVRAEVVKQ